MNLRFAHEVIKSIAPNLCGETIDRLLGLRGGGRCSESDSKKANQDDDISDSVANFYRYYDVYGLLAAICAEQDHHLALQTVVRLARISLLQTAPFFGSQQAVSLLVVSPSGNQTRLLITSERCEVIDDIFLRTKKASGKTRSRWVSSNDGFSIEMKLPYLTETVCEGVS